MLEIYTNICEYVTISNKLIYVPYVCINPKQFSSFGTENDTFEVEV